MIIKESRMKLMVSAFVLMLVGCVTPITDKSLANTKKLG
jgi:hypothetical protein